MQRLSLTAFLEKAWALACTAANNNISSLTTTLKAQGRTQLGAVQREETGGRGVDYWGFESDSVRSPFFFLFPLTFFCGEHRTKSISQRSCSPPRGFAGSPANEPRVAILFSVEVQQLLASRWSALMAACSFRRIVCDRSCFTPVVRDTSEYFLA